MNGLKTGARPGKVSADPARAALGVCGVHRASRSGKRFRISGKQPPPKWLLKLFG